MSKRIADDISPTTIKKLKIEAGQPTTPPQKSPKISVKEIPNTITASLEAIEPFLNPEMLGRDTDKIYDLMKQKIKQFKKNINKKKKEEKAKKSIMFI